MRVSYFLVAMFLMLAFYFASLTWLSGITFSYEAFKDAHIKNGTLVITTEKVVVYVIGEPQHTVFFALTLIASLIAALFSVLVIVNSRKEKREG